MFTLLCFSLYLLKTKKSKETYLYDDEQYKRPTRHNQQKSKEWVMKSLCFDKFLLSQSPRSEHFSHKIDIHICSINPKSVELHNVLVLKCFLEMNFIVKSFQILKALQKIIKLDLVPSNFSPFILIKCSVIATIIIQNHSTNWTNLAKSLP